MLSRGTKNGVLLHEHPSYPHKHDITLFSVQSAIKWIQFQIIYVILELAFIVYIGDQCKNKQHAQIGQCWQNNMLVP